MFVCVSGMANHLTGGPIKGSLAEGLTLSCFAFGPHITDALADLVLFWIFKGMWWEKGVR